MARIHRLTLGKLRKEIEPVTAAQFMRWLLRWQHVASDTRLVGERGLLEIVRQLQGLKSPLTPGSETYSVAASPTTTPANSIGSA